MQSGRRFLALFVTLSLSACSSAPPADDTGTKPGTTGPLTTLSSNTTWSKEKLTGNVVVASGVTLTLSPGASITCAKGASITVRGTLNVSARSRHAKISCPSWQGLVIDKGGKLTADGLELENADTGIRTNAGNAGAAFDYGSIKGADSPFVLEVGSSLSSDHSTFEARGQSEVLGAFHGTFMDYSKGSGDGIILGDDSATMTIEDSVFKGTGGTGDFLVSNKGKKMTVSYTTIEGAHCGFHFDDIGSFDISYSSSNDNQWGAMLYGSREASYLRSSNVIGSSKNIDIQNVNAEIQIQGSNFDAANAAKNSFTGSSMPRVSGNVTTPIADAKPRGTPGM